jgi:fructose-bisphosphate aldolase class I
MSELAKVAGAMVARGKGILAADESTGTIEKRFKGINVESTEENRRAYRELLFTPKGLGDHISGVILYDETIRQKAAEGTPFPELLARQGILPGIKVDSGTSDLAFCPGEKVTEGLDKLAKRCQEYVKLGAKFAKWRAVITIGKDIPTTTCIAANAHALGRYAAICQAAGLVPIVEPEVLMDGDHTIERCEEVTEWTLTAVYQALYVNRVVLEESVLKPSMVISGKDCAVQARSKEVAERTVRVLRHCVPAAVAGIAFLSGGQGDEQATQNLSNMNRMFPDLPWPLTFSYGRALQQPALKAWKGAAGNVAQAQALLAHRARMNGLAAMGQYNAELEKNAA